jgi:hypothetical protein
MAVDSIMMAVVLLLGVMLVSLASALLGTDGMFIHEWLPVCL